MIFARRFTRFLNFAVMVLFAGSPVAADEVIRIMAANTSTGTQDYDNGEGSRIFQGLDPDIARVIDGTDFHFATPEARLGNC